MSDKEQDTKTDKTKTVVTKTTTAKKPASRSKTAPKKIATKPAASKPAAKKTSSAKTATKKAAPRKAAAKTGDSGTAAAAKAVKPAAKSSKGTPSDMEQPSVTPSETSNDSNKNKDEETRQEPNADAAKIVEDLKGRDWPKIIQRALLMFFFGVLGTFALYLSFVLAVAQIGFMIFAGSANDALSKIIRQCGMYIRDVLDYLSFTSDECPFPFGRDLPDVN